MTSEFGPFDFLDAPPPTRKESIVHYANYKCVNCGKEDTLKHFPNEVPAPAVNCWNCGAGRGMDLQSMIMNNKGMFLTTPKEEKK